MRTRSLARRPNPTGAETTFMVLTALGLVGLGGLIYAASKGKKVPTSDVPGGGNTGVVDSKPPAPGGAVTPIPVGYVWKLAMDSANNYTFTPGGRYRISMPPQAGTTFAKQAADIRNENGFRLVDSWDASGTLPTDWPLEDRDPSRWRFDLITSFQETKKAPVGWLVYERVAT